MLNPPQTLIIFPHSYHVVSLSFHCSDPFINYSDNSILLIWFVEPCQAAWYLFNKAYLFSCVFSFHTLCSVMDIRFRVHCVAPFFKYFIGRHVEARFSISDIGIVSDGGFSYRISDIGGDIGDTRAYRVFILDTIYSEILIIKSWFRVIHIIYLIKMM